MPPRRSGGAAYAKGGAVKDGPTWKEGIRSGTPMQNNPAGKNDQADVGRKRVVTYRTGGAVEHKAGSKPTTPHLPGGAADREIRMHATMVTCGQSDEFCNTVPDRLREIRARDQSSHAVRHQHQF